MALIFGMAPYTVQIKKPLRPRGCSQLEVKPQGRKKNKGMKIFYDILEKEPSPDINEGLS
jgi:hypothetical protein